MKMEHPVQFFSVRSSRNTVNLPLYETNTLGGLKKIERNSRYYILTQLK